jgi:hypothetical protein
VPIVEGVLGVVVDNCASESTIEAEGAFVDTSAAITITIPNNTCFIENLLRDNDGYFV